MSDLTKINTTHLPASLMSIFDNPVRHKSSKSRIDRAPIRLVTKAAELGWPAQQVLVIDEDLGVSGSGIVERSGFARLTAEVALGHVGIVLGLEVSRLARNNADWYRLLDLCGLTDTLIGDADGIYHPAMFNDRLVLGLKGTMSEAELHILRARLLGGIRNKAARGELRRGLPVGFVWGEEDGEVRFHPDAAVASAIRTVFARFAELGSVRRVWLWLRSEGLTFPMQTHYGAAIRWIDPSYTAIYHVLTNPVYAGAYVYGKSRRQITLDATGRRKRQIRKLPRSEWSVLIPEHHTGFIDWATYEANRSRIAANAHPQPHHSGGAVREGSALLQGLATCGACGRRLRTHYTGRTASPGYHCAGKNIVDGRGIFCLSVGAVQIDDAVARAVLTALAPAGLEAALAAAERLEADRDDALAQCRLAAERARYEAQRAERRYRAVDAENRLVARGLESEWEQRLRELEQTKAELARRERERPRALSAEDRRRLLALGADLQSVWEASTTTARDRKELLRTLLEEVIVTLFKAAHRARLTLRWRGGSLTDIDVDLPRQKPAIVRTDEDTIALVRRLAAYYPTPSSPVSSTVKIVIPLTVTALPPTMSAVCGAMEHPALRAARYPPRGRVADCQTSGRGPWNRHLDHPPWLNDGFIGGEQLTPGAPWRIRLTEDLRDGFVNEAPKGFLTMYQAMRLLGVSRQTVLQRVKRGELDAIHVMRGKKKGLRIKAISAHPTLFDITS